MKILLVGSGGREDAIAWKIAQSRGTQIFCAPGNPGIAEYATCVPVKATDIDGLLSFALSEQMDLTVVGPEAPLVAGIADRFRKEGHLICGPTAAAAQAEGSKAWFKRLLIKHNLPTAPFEVFTNRYNALAYIRGRGVQNTVIKADGLMGGKGGKTSQYSRGSRV
jgi:phosphoribosylamine--glycine ligase